MTQEIKWDHRKAVSALHKALRRGDEKTAQFAAAYLLRYDLGAQGAWRRILAFPAEDMAGEGAQVVARNYLAWKDARCDEIAFLTIHHLCELVRMKGQLDRSADEFKCAALAWCQGLRQPLPVMVGKWKGEVMPEMRYVGEFAAAATFIYRAMKEGQLEDAAHVSAWLFEFAAKGGERKKMTRLAAWRPLLHFTYRECLGRDHGRVSALYTCYQHGYEQDNWFAALLHLWGLYEPAEATYWEQEQLAVGATWREAVEMVRSGNHPAVPAEALDVHTGHGTLDEWWAMVNALAPASPWREDAVKLVWPLSAADPPHRNGDHAPKQPALIGD
ncbi:MAG: hypothetical protein KA314_04870 [Chloroflexi bacterium]|nr:hypothetical protein [Chloroflexota bacterium]